MNKQGKAVVFMGVAGCGKSSLAQAVSSYLGRPLIEGDDFHSDESLNKMRHGVPLTDEDRIGWLDALGAQLQSHPSGAMLACSALKRSYRDRLRAASPGLRFVFLSIDRVAAHARVEARGTGHLFPASLVDSQFAVLEPPDAEPGVFKVQASESIAVLCHRVTNWLQKECEGKSF